MGNLEDMHNVSSVIARELRAVDIDTPEKLIETGSERAILMLKLAGKEVCISKLYAIEGAIRGIRWHNLDQSTKDSLSISFKSL